MGNQKMKEAMSRIQDRAFDANELVDFEAMLWREKSRDALSGFDQHMNMDGKKWKDLLPLQSKLDMEASGIDEDAKRYQDQAMDCWQTGFSNHQKKIETLKHGDFKQVVIPSDSSAGNFESAMQTKIAILTGLFFVRHQGGSEAMDDFFTFAKKFVEKQDTTFVYESEMGQSLLANPSSLTRLLTADADVVKETVQRLLASSEKISPQKLFSTQPKGFADDLQHMQLRRILVAMIEQVDGQARDLSVKLLLRWGLMRASAEDLLLAAQLQQKYNIDISNELEFICKQSEVFKKPLPEGGSGFDRGSEEHIQSRISHENGSDRAQEHDQCCTDGAKYYIYSDERGMSRGNKVAKTGVYETEQVFTNDKSWNEMTMLCHDGLLLVRHATASDVPFEEFSKETLKPIAGQEPWGMAEGEDYLKWTPKDTDYPENANEGNRWMRASPMFSDGELIYLLVQYRQKGFDSPIVRTVCETYEISDDRKLKRTKETNLYKNDQGDYYKGSKKTKDKGGHLARGAMACNGSVLLWWSAHNFHVYDLSNGVRNKKEHINSTSMVSCYDAKEMWYYYMDAACYSWLKRRKIEGFKPRSLTKEVKELPDLPIVFDTHKSEIIAQIAAEKKKDEPENEEEKKEEKKEDETNKMPRTDLFEMLAKQDEQVLDHYISPKEEEKKRKTEPIANISEISQAIIFSKMSTDAQAMSFKVKNLGDKKLLAEEMLPYFKSPFAVYGSKSYFIQIRLTLADHFDKLNDGKITTMKQSNVLNLLRIYQANIDCLMACRIEMKHILPEAELKLIKTLQFKLEFVELFDGQAQKSDEDLTDEEIFQIYLVEAASKLNQTLEANLDCETRLEKLNNIEANLGKAMENEEGPEAKIIKRVIPLMGSKKALADIFSGDQEELAISRRIIAMCIDYLVGKVSGTVANSVKTKVFQHREFGINKDIRAFTKAFCQELMVAFGNQLLTILEKQDCKKEGELSQEEEATLKQLHEAQERKKILEPMLYETFILISQRFKSLIQDITKQVTSAKVYEWEDIEQVKGFYDFISVLFKAEKSIPHITLMYSLMMSAHKPELIWLDEISEALKNCAEGLNAYLVMNENLPLKVQTRIKKLDQYGTLVRESLRAICYSIGVVAYRLILLNKDESEDKKRLNTLNILQGGIEGRFIPSLSQETKTQIEGSFKITNDKQLQKLANQQEDSVITEASDSLLQGIIDQDKSQEKIENVLAVLQQGLVTKQPMVPTARIGGEWGSKLTRAAFSTMIKFSDSFDSFLRLTESVDKSSKSIGDEEKGAQKIKSITNLLKEQASEDFFTMLKQWEQASVMRKWTQKVKLNLSERLTTEVESKLREEITAANPSKEPFTAEFNEEQKSTIEQRFNEQFDKELPEKYSEAIKKARFLIKMAVPRAFRDAKHQHNMEKVKKGIAGVFSNNLDLFRNRSTVNTQGVSSQAPALQRALTAPRRGSVSSGNSVNGMKRISSQIQRSGTLLINDGSINKKDTEVDWMERLKQWKKRQQTDGAVTSFEDQMQQQNHSAIFSVLGCLQASFTSKSLEDRVEQSLVNGLRRSAGLHLINYVMNLTYDRTRFADMIQWLQGSLRNNLMQTTHYLTGLEGCGIKAESGIQQQFFQIMDRVVHVLKHEKLNSSTEYVHLLNGLCWSYTREDHPHLVQLGVFRTLQCGDGTLMHPFQRAWGQEESNFQLERNRETQLCLASRLRQVFEFLVQTVLEGLFVKQEEENLDVGGEDVQDTMKGKSQTYNREASESLLTTICDTLFDNTHRYLRMKSLFSKDYVLNEEKIRFNLPKAEDDSNFDVKNRCPRDLAIYINKNGGHRIFTANKELETHFNLLKAQMFIQKIEEAGSVDIESSIAELVRMIAMKSLNGADRSVASAIPFIISRDYRTLAAIKTTSWEDLGLEQPVLTMEEKSEVTGLSVEEYKAIAEAANKAKLEEEEAKRKEEAGEEDVVEEPPQIIEAPIEVKPTAMPQAWLCSACTFRNAAVNNVCEMCQSPKHVVQPSAAAAGNTDAAAAADWQCSACTLNNDPSTTVCSVCGTAKPEAEAVIPEPVTEATVVESVAADSAPALPELTENQPVAEGQSEEVQPADAQAASTEEVSSFQEEENKSEVNVPDHPEEEKKQEEVPEEAPEEVKEPELTADQRQAEEEKQIQGEQDPKARYTKYLSFLLTVQDHGGAVAVDDNKIEGNMYTDTSLFRIIRSLDQLITLSEVSQEGYQIVQRFSNPQNLKHIIELSVETSTQNQILIQRILQQILALDLPQEILDESVRLAQQPADIKDKPNQVYKLLLRPSALDFSGSLFLKFLFNRLEKSRKALYKSSLAEDNGLNSVVSESVRTIRTLYTEPDKNVSLRKIVNEAFTSSLMAIQDMSEIEIDSVMSLIPEAAFKRMAIGTPCVNKEGKVFSVVGVLNTDQENNMYQDIPLYPNYTPDHQCLSLAGLYYDPENPARQDMLKEKMIYSQPLLDLDEEQTIQAAKLSVFMDPVALEQLIEIAVQDESTVEDEKAKNALSLLQTFIVRGLYNMTRVLKGEYIKFLQQFDLLSDFFKLLLGTATELSAAPEEHLVSSLQLELRADYIREAVMTSNKKCIGKQVSGGGSVFTSDDGSQIYLMRNGSESPEDIFHFKSKTQFGPEEGKYFEGPVVESQPELNNGGIFLVPSSTLQEPNKATMQIIKAAKIIITDSGCDFDEFMKTMKNRILQDQEQFKQCGQTRFFVLETAEEVEKIASIIEHGSTHKNTEITDRGYFLGLVLKNIEQNIWEKVDKSEYRKKFASIGIEHNYEAISTTWGTQILAELIETKFGQEDSFMQQISMGETFELIRSGALIGVAEEEKKEVTDEEAGTLKKQMSQKLIDDVENQASLPNFTEILTKTEKLVSDVAENFYSSDVPSKPDASTYAQNFKETIFTSQIEPADVAKNYHTTLKTLKQSYSREILLNILSSAQDSLDDSSKQLISSKSSFAKLCDLIHNDYMVSSQVNEFHGNPQILAQSKENITALLTFMKEIPQFTDYFVTDLLARASMTLEKAANEDFAKVEQFTLKGLRKVMDGGPLLDPLVLLFLRDQIFELGYVTEDKLPETIKAFFDLLMGYALVFKRSPDYYLCLDLLKIAKKTLTLVDVHLAKFVEKASLVTDLFASKLVQCLVINMNLDSETLKDRQKLALELIVKMVKLQQRLKEEFGTVVELGFELSSSVKKALAIFKTIEEGDKFTTFMTTMRFQAIVKSKTDSKKIWHIARNYCTDDKKFECKFKKEVTATDKDLLIKIDGHSSNELIQIKKEGQTMLADAGSLRSGKSLVMQVPKGTTATIEFPVRPQIVQFAGRMYCRNQDTELVHDDWTSLQETAQCAATQVIAMHQSVMFIGGDESVWGMGYRAQGQGADNCKLRRIPAPDTMRNFKKVAHGKFFRLVLTEPGRLFWLGQSRKYMMGLGSSGTARLEEFHDMGENYFRIGDGDKLIDVCGGKNFTAVVTEMGKIYATSYMFWRKWADCRHNSENNEDYPFELRMPEGYKAKQIWASEKNYNLWVTGTDANGAFKTFGGGETEAIYGTGEDTRCSVFKPFAVPDGTYMTKVTSHAHLVHGIDNNHNLWVWGSGIYGAESDEDKAILYSGERGNASKPMLMKWFKEQTLKVLDVSSGDTNALVKTEDKDGKIVFYGLSLSEDNLKRIGGAASLTSEYKHFISRLSIDGAKVEDFAMGKESSYILMAADNNVPKSIDPENPLARGLMHFYQEPDSKNWKFVSQEQYEAQKDSLPEVCFATRHPMNGFLERVKRIRAEQATPEDLSDESLPSLNSIVPGMDFDQAATEHACKTTNHDASIPAASPLYYSYSKISSQEQKVFATETEAQSGDQAWDMDPVIYYRVKSPARAMEKLPLIDLALHFTQASASESVSFTIMDEQINQDEIEAVEITDEVTLDLYKKVLGFTPQQDSELLKLMDAKVSAKGSKIEGCKSAMFPFDASSLKPGSPLESIDEKAVQMRNSMLFKFSKAFSRAVKYVSSAERNDVGTISYQHFQSKGMVISAVINEIVDGQLGSLANGGRPDVKVNRRKAFEFGEEGNVDHEGKYSIFGQICNQLRESSPDMSHFRHSSVDEKCYSIKYLGEGSIDAGGPFRESLVNIVDEMEAGLVPLMIKSPNNRNDHGTNRDCYILNPTSTSPAHLEMYKYLGGYIAYGILSKSPIPLNLAPTVWKAILGERMSLSDLESIDAYSSQILTDLQSHGASLSDADFAAGVDQNFTSVLSNGDEVELCDNGQDRQVTKESIDEFIGLVLKARFAEAAEQIKAIQDGLNTVFLGNLGLISYLNADAIEVRACGSREIDMDRLKSITTYQSCSLDHELVQRFWRTFEAWTNEERSLYLKFVWGRNRLPAVLSGLSRKHEVRLYTNLSETGFPQAHTCFFQLDIPFYRTDEICTQRMSQAIQLCGTIDTDNNNFAEE